MEMPRGALLGRLFGTDIYATGGFLLVMAYMLIMNRAQLWAIAAWEFALIPSILVHEFGHVFAVRRFTGGSSVVVLWGLGGLCIHEPTEAIKKRIGISLMGPAFGFVLGAIAWLVARYVLPGPDTLGPQITEFMHAMIVINIYYTVLNLLPILPLDGGQATLAALESKLGPAKALRATRRVSIVTAVAGLAAAVSFYPNPVLVLIAGVLLFQNLLANRFGL